MTAPATFALSTTHLIDEIITRWEAPTPEHEVFRDWAARLMIELEAMPLRAAAVLEKELRELHGALASRLVEHGFVDEALLSRRVFVAHLLATRG